MPDSILSASSNVQPVFEMLILDPSNTKGYTAEEFEQLRQEHFAIRKKVFCDEQGFSAEDEFDEYDGIDPSETQTKAALFLLRLVQGDNHIPVGAIRGYRPKVDSKYYKLGRLAVLPEHRKYKLGQKLVLALHDWVKLDADRLGWDQAVIVAHSQLYVIPFYAKYGYVVEGEEFDEDGAPHKKVVHTFPIHRAE